MDKVLQAQATLKGCEEGACRYLRSGRSVDVDETKSPRGCRSAQKAVELRVREFQWEHWNHQQDLWRMIGDVMRHSDTQEG